MIASESSAHIQICFNFIKDRLNLFKIRLRLLKTRWRLSTAPSQIWLIWLRVLKTLTVLDFLRPLKAPIQNSLTVHDSLKTFYEFSKLFRDSLSDQDYLQRFRLGLPQGFFWAGG